MKKTFLIQHTIFLLAILFMVGCQKQIEPLKEEKTQLNEEGADQAAARGGDNSRGCRVTAFDYYDGIADVHQIDYYTYKRGLVDEWAVAYGGVYKMEYNSNDRLKKSKYYVDGALVYTIHFFYRNDKVVKEIWYNGNTTDVYDEVIYTFDRKGRIIRGESFINSYYTDNTYTSDGDLTSWKLYSGGSPLVSGHYTYYDHYKSPFVEGTPGINYNFPYANSTFGYTKWWYSSEKITFYDEAGNSSVYYDQNPRKTRWHIGSRNYPVLVDYFDRLSGTHLSVGFEYENCGRGHGGDHKSNEMNNRKVSASNGKSVSFRSILSGPRGEIKQRVNELRKELKNKLQQ